MANTLNLGTDGNWAVKENNLLAYNDENNIFKPIDFDFTRDSGATRVNKQGLIENVPIGVPRIDFSDGKGSLLLEPQRTNHFQQSNQFDTTWQISAVGISVTPNQVGVGNSQDAWKLTEGAFDGEHYIRQTPNIGGVVSVSVYAKAGTNDFLYIRGVNGGLNKRTWFNLSNGTVGTSQGISAEMISMGDGWYRCVMVLDHQTAFEYYIGVSNADGVSSYQGSNKYIYIQNAQLEQGSYPTSYIPTNGATATRNAETSSKANISNLIGQTEGTVFVDVDFVGVNESITNQIFFIREQDSNNGYLSAGFYQGKLNVGLRVGGSTKFDLFFGGVLTKGRYKIAIAYSSGNTKVFVNENQVGSTMTQTFGVNNFAQIYNGAAFNGANQLGDISRNLRVYNTALTDAELISLTS